MTGYGRYRDRQDVKDRNKKKELTAELVLNTDMSSQQIAERLGVTLVTVNRYRAELVAEGRIPKFKRGKRE